ncbi:hypothetical protein LEN26_005755 [Aphanomyces euteiches]|nr:hypothetical protein AeMF1_001195 [Aphanomyces euteiches]KAH9137389.1 hypothetical protein LEN26_005755 [Aphanomyces euteiches]KAH9197711.1 hypothetical protein AeNC1_000295 [Aphanomyces euteiches]
MGRGLHVSWICRAMAHTFLVLCMTYHAVEIDYHLYPYTHGLHSELWRLVNGGESPQPLELFTIEESVNHGHAALANYFALPTTALGNLRVASARGANSPVTLAEIPLPTLHVVYASQTNPDQETEKTYKLEKNNDKSWPDGLRQNASVLDRRLFFDSLKSMDIIMGVESHRPRTSKSKTGLQHMEYMRWDARFLYDFSNQGQILLSMDVTRQMPSLEYAIPEPSHFLGRYAAFIIVAVIYLALEALDIFNALLMSSMATVLQTKMSSFVVIATNIATIACFVHAFLQASYIIYVQPLSSIYALACAAQWITLLRFLGFNPRTYILGLTLRRGVPHVFEFLIGVFPLFVGYIVFGAVMFGATVPRFAGVAATATTLFAIANGDEIRETFLALPWLGHVYLYSYIVLFAYVVLMVCIGIMEDAFFTAVFPTLWKKQSISEDEWKRIVELIQNETEAQNPNFLQQQGEILSNVQRQLF